MKTLVNKQNPAIRITAPEIRKAQDSPLFESYYTIKEGYGVEVCLSEPYWTLVEEEPADLEKVAEEDVAGVFERMELTGEYVYTPTAQSIARGRFKAGVEWMKKQDELTWKDLQKLDIIANKLWQDGKYDKNDAQEFYTEVLKHFNEYKEQKNK